MKRILYATDRSCGALAAGRYLSHLPHRHDVRVHIITVLPKRAATSGDAILEEATQSLGNFPGHVTTAATRGEAPDEVANLILATGEYVHADLIVVGDWDVPPLPRGASPPQSPSVR